jgi:hypothetical protein
LLLIISLPASANTFDYIDDQGDLIVELGYDYYAFRETTGGIGDFFEVIAGNGFYPGSGNTYNTDNFILAGQNSAVIVKVPVGAGVGVCDVPDIGFKNCIELSQNTFTNPIYFGWNTGLWSTGLFGFESPSDLLASVANGVQNTAAELWPLLAFLGVAMAFTIATMLVGFMFRAISDSAYEKRYNSLVADREIEKSSAKSWIEMDQIDKKYDEKIKNL